MASLTVLFAIVVVAISGSTAWSIFRDEDESSRVFTSDSSSLRSKRDAHAHNPSKVCIDVISFVKDLDKTKAFCTSKQSVSHQKFCKTLLRRLTNQVQMASDEGKGSLENSKTLHGHVHAAAVQGKLAHGPDERVVDTKQEVRNITFHLAVFCASHPIFCQHQLSGVEHAIGRRSVDDVEENSSSPRRFQPARRQHLLGDQSSAPSEALGDERAKHHDRLRRLADQNGEFHFVT